MLPRVSVEESGACKPKAAHSAWGCLANSRCHTRGQCHGEETIFPQTNSIGMFGEKNKTKQKNTQLLVLVFEHITCPHYTFWDLFRTMSRFL